MCELRGKACAICFVVDVSNRKRNDQARKHPETRVTFVCSVGTHDTRPAILPTATSVDGPRTSEGDETRKIEFSRFLGDDYERARSLPGGKANVPTNGLRYNAVRTDIGNRTTMWDHGRRLVQNIEQSTWVVRAFGLVIKSVDRGRRNGSDARGVSCPDGGKKKSKKGNRVKRISTAPKRRNSYGSAKYGTAETVRLSERVRDTSVGQN